MRIVSSLGVALLAATFSLSIGSALAASAVQKECSEKYQAAKSGGTLNGMTYNQYYSQCAAAAKAGPAPAAEAAPAAAPAGAPETKAELKAEKKAEKAREKAEKKEEKERAKTEPTPTATAPAPAAPAPRTTSASQAPAGNAIFPTSVSAEFSKETAGKARMHTCLAQYKANKAGNGNGGLKWIEKGGGYYSECNKRLKG